jgi:site-specific DNA-adenine methylase
MKNHFIIPYTGNKRREVEIIYKNLKLYNITTIIEPFCGSCALSYYISTQQPNKFKYVLNDLDKYLIELINIMKHETQYKEFITKIINLCFEDDKFISKEKYNMITKRNDVIGYFISRKFYTIRCGLYPVAKINNKPEFYIKKLLDIPFLKFVRTEDITITNTDGIEIYNKYKCSKQNLYFLILLIWCLVMICINI